MKANINSSKKCDRMVLYSLQGHSLTTIVQRGDHNDRTDGNSATRPSQQSHGHFARVTFARSLLALA